MKRSYDAATIEARRRIRPWRRLGRYRYSRLRWRALFAALDFLGRWLWGQWGRNGRQFGQPSPEPLPSVRRVLLVQLDHLGDAVLTTAVLPALQARFPAAEIDVLAATWNHEVFATRPEIKRVHVSRWNRFSRGWRFGWPLGLLAWGWRLRRERYDLAIDVRGELPIAALIWLCGARRRLGWDAGGGGFLLTDSAEYVRGRHEVSSRAALLRAIDAAHDVALPRLAPSVPVRPDVQQAIDRRLRELPGGAGPLVALHISAGTEAKRWPADHWQELLGRMALEFDARVILVGSDDDRTLALAVTGGHTWPGVVDWTGQLSIEELAATLGRVDLFVGADSGPAHIAAAADTRVVVLFSGTNDSRQWRPVGHRVMVLRHEVACSPCHRESCVWTRHECMAELRPATVIRAMAAMLRSGEVPTATVLLPLHRLTPVVDRPRPSRAA